MEDVTLEELALAVQNGNDELMPLLWERTERLVKMLILRHIRNRILPNSIDTEDLLQCGYFALLRAVRAFKPDKEYKFNTYLNYSVQNVINEEIDGRKRHTFKETSYNKPIMNDDGEETEWLDLLKDDRAERNIIELVELTDTQRIVIEAVEQLLPEQRKVIHQHYFKGLTLKQIAELNKCSIENIRQYEHRAFKALRKNSKLRSLNEEIQNQSYIHSFSRFQYSPEYFETIRKVEQLERETAEYMTYGKRQAKIYLMLYRAEQEFNKKYA